MMIRGQAFYAKVLGSPVKGYNEGDLEWSIDVTVDEATRAKLAELGFSDFYIKPAVNPRTGKEHASGMDYIQFRRNAKRRDGTDAKPIAVVDRAGKPWPQDKLIGNGSVINVILGKKEVKQGRETRNKPTLIRMQVWDYVPYEASGGSEYTDFPIDEDWSEEND